MRLPKIILLLALPFWMAPSLLSASPAVADSLGASYTALADTAKISTLITQAFSSRSIAPKWAWECVNEAIRLSEANGDHRRAEIILCRGTLNWTGADFEAAQHDYRLARSLHVDAGDSLGIAKADNNLGLVYWSMSYHHLALEANLRALPYFERKKDSLRLPTLYNNIGNIYNRIDDRANAEAYYLRAHDILKRQPASPTLYMVMNNLGLVKAAQNHTLEAIRLYEEALQGYKALGDPNGQVSVLNNLGASLLKQERVQEAEAVQRQAHQLAEAKGTPYDQAICALKLAELMLKSRRAAEALPWAEAAYQKASMVKSHDLDAAVHETLAAAYDSVGDHRSALVHLRRHMALRDSILDESKSRAIAELQLQHETALKDQEIIRLDQDAQLGRLRTAILLVAIALLLVTATLIVLRQRAVMRREKLLQAKDKEVFATQAALHEAQQRAALAEQQRMRDELAYKAKEITTLAMNIVRKNELLEALDAELKALRKGAGKDGSEEKLKDLSLLLTQNLNSEKERKEIELYIDEAQGNFFLELDRRFPGLSIKDKRLCAMIRQGLSSKEIAAVFNINTASVEVSRYRLRKKMGLDPNQDLQTFMGAI